MIMSKKRIGIVVSRFNEDITRALLDGALKAAAESGISKEEIDIYWVPGAFELPLVAKKMALTKQVDAVVCLGAVLQGETKHFDYVCQGVSMGVTQVTLETEKPVLFGVLTCDRKQAIARTQPDRNKGYDVMLGALEMIDVCSKVDAKTEKLLQ